MTECPVKKCDEITEIKHVLYGREGTGGLVGCMRKFITKRQVWAGFCTVGIILGIMILRTWSGQETDPLRYVPQPTFSARITEVDTSLATIQSNQRFFAEALSKIEKDREERNRTLKDIFNKLHSIELKLPKDTH